MVLTYKDAAHIPSKLSLFYAQAYESLFQKHDAIKAGFQRERRSSLDIQDFERAFSAFCLLSYDRGDFSFSRIDALAYLDKGKSLSLIEYTSADVLDDSIQAVCLLLEDGLDLVFAHRSFQEYFVARFVNSVADADARDRLVRQLGESGRSDTVIGLLYEMGAAAVERNYLLPAIDRLKSVIHYKSKVGITHYLAYLKTFFTSFRCFDDATGPSATLKDPSLFGALLFTRGVLKGEVPAEAGASTRAWRARACELLQAEAAGKSELRAASLTTTSPFVRHLVEADGAFGIGFVRRALAVSKAIEQRQSKVAASLADLLQNPGPRRADTVAARRRRAAVPPTR